MALTGSRSAPLSLGHSRSGLRHASPLGEAVLACDHDVIASRKSAHNHGPVVLDLAHFDLLAPGGLIGRHEPDVRSIRSALYGLRWYGDGVRLGPHNEPDLYEVARPKLMVLVVEACLELDRAARGIDLVVNGFESPATKRSSSVLIQGENGRLALSGSRLNQAQVGLGHREVDRNRLDLCDRSNIACA